MKSFFGLTDIDVGDKTVLLRADFNVPLKDGKILDNNRIKAVLPTVNYLLEHRAKQVIIISHLGRPNGKIVEEFRLGPVAEELEIGKRRW